MILSALGMSATAAAALASSQTFVLGATVWNASVSTLSGRDTNHAVLIGRVHSSDAETYCGHYRDGPHFVDPPEIGRTTYKACVRKVMGQERGKDYKVVADCTTGELRSEDGRVVILADHPDRFGELQWRFKDTGKLMANVAANNDVALQDQFQRLCPTKAASVVVSAGSE